MIGSERNRIKRTRNLRRSSARLMVVGGVLFGFCVPGRAQTNTVPYSDSFESYADGQLIDGTHGWQAASPSQAVVTNLAYTYDHAAIGYPVPGSHTRGLKFDTTLSNVFETVSGQVLWFDVILEAGQVWTGAVPPAVEADANASLYVNESNRLVIAHAEYGNQTHTVWSAFAATTLPTGAWNRVTLCLDYRSQDTGEQHLYYSVLLNGTALSHPQGRGATDGTGAGGPWFPMIGKRPFGGFQVDGTGHLDDVVVTTDAVYPSVSVSDVSVTEGDSGSTDALFTVTLSATSALPVQVDYATADGSATGGVDYVSAADTLVIPAGVLQTSIAVQVNGDLDQELDETFTLALSAPQNAIVGAGVGTATLEDDDEPPPPPPPAGGLAIYEGFDYTAAQPLAGQVGGTGWGTNGWRTTGDNPLTVASPGLTFGGLGAAGLAVQRPIVDSNATAARDLGVSLPTNATDTLWFAALFQRGDAGNNGRGFALTLASEDFTPSPAGSKNAELATPGNALGIHMTKSGNAIEARAWEGTATASDISSTSATLSTNFATQLIVGRIVWGAGNADHALSLYEMTPGALSTEPTNAFASLTDIDFDPSTLDRISHYDSKLVIMDEIWVGEAYAGLFDRDGDGIPDTWEVDAFNDLTTADHTTDWDMDGSSDFDESRAGTNPQNAGEYLAVTGLSPDGAPGKIVIRWSSVPGMTYALLSKTNLMDPAWDVLTNGIPATPTVNTYTSDVTAAPLFLGIDVE